MIRRPPRSTQSRSSAASDVYKRQVQKHLVSALGRMDRGTEKTSLYLVSHIDTMPAALVECAFISNGEEERLLREDSFQQLSLIHISEPTRLGLISYAVFCLKKTPDC